MSNLYDDASLIMFPSGYKEDKIYSLKPTDGSGDLTFTRASTATRVNADGLIETSPVNLLQNSENFSAVWANQNVTITTNSIVAPNGTTTADSLIAANGVNGASGVYVAESTSVVKTISCYVKKGSKRWAVLVGYNGNSNCWYDLDNGVVGARGANYSTSSITSVGNGWYRIDAVVTVAIGLLVNIGIYAADNDNSRTCTGDGTTVSLYIWGAQVNSGATAKTYFPTTDRLNVPRIDYTGGGCGKLLLEPQRTNLVLRSEEFDNAYWSKTGATITANAATSPDGYVNADTLVENSSTAIHAVFQNAGVTIAVGTATFSVFVKPNGRNFFQIRTGSAAGITNAPLYANFDLVDDLVTAQSVGANSAKIESYANGWKRCSVSFTITSGATVALVYQPITSGTAVIAESYAGDGTSGVFLWGAQLEAGAYATSYIPTLASSVTRLADSASKTGISSLIGQTEGTLFVETTNLFASGTRTIALLYTSGSAFYQMYINASNQVRVDVNGSFLFLGGSIAANTNYKIAFAYKSGEYALYINGTQIATSASTTMPSSLTAYYLGNALGGEQSGAYKQAILFQTRLSNAELATLTTL